MINLESVRALDSTITSKGTYFYIHLQGKLVCVIRPSNYTPSKRILFHYHGFRQVEEATHGATPQMTMEHFGFMDALHDIAPGTLMVCPIGNKDRYDLGYLWGSIYAIIPALIELGEPFDQVTLSGHSGAYMPIGQVLDGGTGKLPVNNVFLFDATYSSHIEPEVSWLRNSNHRMWSAARDGTWVNTREIATRVGHNFTAVHTSGDHWGVVNKFFPQFLRESLDPHEPLDLDLEMKKGISS